MFANARIKLTLLYAGIITLIMIIFSVILFHYTVQHIQDNVEEDGTGSHTQQTIADRTIGQLANTIIVSDIVVILLATILSYFLSEKTLKPIKIALHAQDQFSAHASHELRTPLAVMKTENEVFLKNSHTTLEEAHILALSNLEEINRMTNMVEDLLILARSKRDGVNTEMTSIDISKIITTSVHNLQKSAEIKKLTLTLSLPSSVFVTGNERLLIQAFYNIIQNAITYTKKGEISVILEGDKDVTIKVTDTGIGISDNDLLHITEAFYKADTSRHVVSGGVGLGLSIVKEIISLHKGTLSIKSQLGKGTNVVVILPTFRAESS